MCGEKLEVWNWRQILSLSESVKACTHASCKDKLLVCSSYLFLSTQSAFAFLHLTLSCLYRRDNKIWHELSGTLVRVSLSYVYRYYFLSFTRQCNASTTTSVDCVGTINGVLGHLYLRRRKSSIWIFGL